MNIQVKLLSVLIKCRHNNFRYILTGDESWFFYFSPHRCKWIHEDNEPPGIPKVGFHEPKRMVIIFWNIYGIALLKIFLPGEHINSTTFFEKVLDPLTGYPTFVEAKMSRKKFYLHFDNARPHKAKCFSDYMQLKKFTTPPHPA